MRIHESRAWRLLRLALFLSLMLPRAAAAAVSCGSSSLERVAVRAGGWPAPLDRVLTLNLRNVPLRDALDRVAAAARLRFTYSDEQLPLDRQVCASFEGAQLGDVLAHLLRGVAVTPVAAGTDQVILAPRGDPEPATPVVTLDRIVVTGSASGAPQRELPIALTVIGRNTLEDSGMGTLSQLLDATVPGMWAWEQSPGSITTGYGGIRGASSFGITAPKVYLDGIQIANPLLFSQFPAASVERIEVIRGPQGTALYGADALTGVINVVTRRDHLEPSSPRASLQSSVGMAQSSYAPGGTVTQSHGLNLSLGSDVRSGGLSLDYGSVGAFMPGVYNRHFSANGNARVVGQRSIFTLTGRLFAEQAGVAMSPLLRDSVPVVALDTGSSGRGPLYARSDSTPNPQSVWEYTFGGSATFAQSQRWTHSLVVGVDGYHLAGVLQDLMPTPWATDSAMNAARGAADRGTLRLSSVARFGDERASGTLTLAAEHSTLHENTAVPESGPLQLEDGPEWAPVSRWQNMTAGIAQAQASLRDAFFLTGGLRLERNSGLLEGRRTDLLPMIGASVVHDGPVTVKLRAAYGKGIRPAQTPARETMWTGFRREAENYQLEPERQAGAEAGIDVYLGRFATLQLTRYDQLASGLIQRVGTMPDTSLRGSPGVFEDSVPGHRMEMRASRYALQNLGAITNRGWEFQATAKLTGLWLSGSLSQTDSRVHQVESDYAGDLRGGDRVLDVPAWTAGAMATWNAKGWTGSLAAYRAFDWIGYDRLALARATQSAGGGQIVGAALRAYWRRYDGVTHLRASLSRNLPHGLSALLTGDNLLNRQFGEPDNVTVLPGRSFSLGLRASF